MESLQGHVALVTGASQGIGRACAVTLAKAGATVALAARNAEKLNDAVAEIESAGGKAAAVPLDVSSEDAIKSAVKAIAAQMGKIDILVNNAGITRDGLLLRMKRADWDDIFTTNLTAPFLLTQAVLGGMMKQRWGRIINIASIVGEIGAAGQANYASSKAGLIGLTLSVAREVASRNITVNAVAPGYIVTAMTDAMTEEQKKSVTELIPLGRVGTDLDIANAVRFLAGSQASLLLGKTYFAARDYEQAAASLAKFPANDPAYAQASFYLGLSEFHLGHFEKASAAFKATAERVPLTEVLNNIGAAESRRGRRTATDYFQKAIKADPSDPDYHFNLAVALYRAGDAPAAQRQLNETLRLRPGDTEAKQFADAILASPSPAVPFSRIKHNYDESSYRQLSLELQNAIEESIRKAKPAAQASMHLERARELLANGAADQAESQFRASLAQDPGNPDALAGLAHALLLENNFAEALQQAQAAIAIEPSSEAYLVLARAALHDRDRSAANQNLQKALAFGPADEDTRAVAQEIQNQAAEDAQGERR